VRRLLFVVIVVLLLPLSARAQDCTANCTLTIDALPAVGSIAWDAGFAIVSYQVLVDGVPNGAAVSQSPAPVTIATAGLHQIVVQGISATGAVFPSPPLTVTVSVTASVPTAPTNLRVTWMSSAVVGASSVTDVQVGGHHWVIVNAQTWRDGVWAGQGQATEYLVLPSGLYCLGTDRAWYRWDDAAQQWVFVGTKPTA
jgi:hypothetical protein